LAVNEDAKKKDKAKMTLEKQVMVCLEKAEAAKVWPQEAQSITSAVGTFFVVFASCDSIGPLK